jgi:hypothetical protein
MYNISIDILITLLLFTSIYVNWNLFTKIEKLEEANEEATDWILGYGVSLDNILTKIKDLDSKNIFESDDEVGVVFKSIKETIESLEELKNND